VWCAHGLNKTQRCKLQRAWKFYVWCW
jgi:hypothetical protein